MKPHFFRLAAAPLFALALMGSLPTFSATPHGEPNTPHGELVEPRTTPQLASASPAFDNACANYYRQGNDPEVPTIAAQDFCACLAEKHETAGLGPDALDFYARTLSGDLTTFIHEYPEGDAWMEQSFQAEAMCKTG